MPATDSALTPGIERSGDCRLAGRQTVGGELEPLGHEQRRTARDEVAAHGAAHRVACALECLGIPGAVPKEAVPPSIAGECRPAIGRGSYQAAATFATCEALDALP